MLIRKHSRLSLGLAAFLLAATNLNAQKENFDISTIQKIRQEGLQDSHVMDITFHLTNASGDRLTSDPAATQLPPEHSKLSACFNIDNGTADHQSFDAVGLPGLQYRTTR
ncbi:MAG TPA: hypothetical protein VL978_13590 [Puia sp.]|nr:hypothetical protein [Puia sp.]